MEAKDWLTLACSVTAIAISVMSLRLNLRREQRDIEADLPKVDFFVAHFDRNDFLISYSVTNRDQYPLILHEIAVVNPPPRFRIDGPDGQGVLTFETRPVGVVIEPGETFSENLSLHEQGIGNGAAQRSITLAFKTSVRGHRSSERVLQVRRAM